MSKVYLHATGIDKFEWVDKRENATAGAEESMKVTLKQFKSAELERAPKKNEVHEPDWIISTDA